MFGLFKKKEAPKAEPPAPQNDRLREFAARFQPEELPILAVTGPGGCGAERAGEDELWMVSIGLTAWMEEDSPDIHQGKFRLVCPADDTLRGYLRQRMRGDFLLKFRARVSLDGSELWLVDLPEPGFDPDLKAILEAQKKPESFWEEGLGTFTLNRQVDLFEAEIQWMGTEIALIFDQDGNRADCVMNAKALLAAAADWDKRVREYAADELLASANDWAEQPEGEEPEEITREQFMERMELESVEVREDGAFDFWFNDGELFWGHSIHVWGTLADGPTDARMEG